VPGEGAFFKFPAISLRTSSEWPECLEKGNFIIGNTLAEQLLQADDIAIEMNNNGNMGTNVPDYIDENVSVKVIRIIQGYTGIINKIIIIYHKRMKMA
jgi:UDP-N-acetylglucosamine 2-epimerase (non-hydrolysing)